MNNITNTVNTDLETLSTHLNVLTMQPWPMQATPKTYCKVGANTSLDVSNRATTPAGFGLAPKGPRIGPGWVSESSCTSPFGSEVSEVPGS